MIGQRALVVGAKEKFAMKVTTPQIVWHSKEPVFCADFHRSGELWRLVTGGADKDVKASLLQDPQRIRFVRPPGVKI